MSLRVDRLFLLILSLVIAGLFGIANKPVEAATNLAREANYVFSPAARYPHTHSPDDATKLTDGEFAFGHFWTSRTHTAGWIQSGVIRIDLELSKPSEIENVVISTAHGASAEVSFPQRTDIYASVDGQNYRYLGDLLKGADLGDGPYKKQKFSSQQLNAAARYLTLFITPQGKYTFLDEIEVYGKSDKAPATNHEYPLAKAGITAHQSARAKLQQRLDSLSYLRDHLSTDGNISTAPIVTYLGATVENLDSLEATLFADNAGLLNKRFGESLLVWKTSPYEKFSPVSSPDDDWAGDGALQFDVMSGGTIAESLAIVTTEENGTGVRLFIDKPETNSLFPVVSIREAMPVATANGEILTDPLMPVAGETVALRAGEARQIWLTVQGDTPPGVYEGSLHVAATLDGAVSRSVPIRIKVWPVTLSSDLLPNVNAWAYLNWRQIKTKQKAALKDLRAHHVNVAIVHPSQLPWPEEAKSISETVGDFRVFESVIERQPEARCFLLYLGFNDPFYRSLGGSYPVINEQWRLGFVEWATRVVTRMYDLGVDIQDIYFYPVDEPDSSEEVEIILEVAELLRGIDPELRLFTTLDRMDRLSDSYFEALSEAIDIAQISELDLDSRRAQKLRELGKDVWAYNASGGKTANPFSVYRLQAWRAFKNGATGVGFWAYADTGPRGTAWDDYDGTRPDYSVIYEDNVSMISSKRWEAWREGVEDYALLSLAEGNLRNKLEEAEFWDLVDGVISHPEDYVSFQEARRRLLDIASR